MYNVEISIEAFVLSAFVALVAAPSCLSTCWFRMIVCDICACICCWQVSVAFSSTNSTSAQWNPT